MRGTAKPGGGDPGCERRSRRSFFLEGSFGALNRFLLRRFEWKRNSLQTTYFQRLFLISFLFKTFHFISR